MKIIKQEVEAKGILETEFGSYTLLDIMPTQAVLPPRLRESNIWAFYVKDYHDDFAKYIYMAGDNWLIRPLAHLTMTLVTIEVEEENVKVQSLEE